MNIFRIICTFALSLLVLISSSSFMVGIHLCKGKVKHIAILTKAEACEKEKKLPPCHKHIATPCCDDESVVHEGEGFKASTQDISIGAGPVSDIEIPVVVLAEIIPSATREQLSYYNYHPPLRSPDLTVAYRVFII